MSASKSTADAEEAQRVAVPAVDPRIWEEAERFDRFWRANYDVLLGQHPDEFVAVLQERVVAHGRRLGEVVHALRNKGLDPSDVRIEFLPTDPKRYVY